MFRSRLNLLTLITFLSIPVIAAAQLKSDEINSYGYYVVSQGLHYQAKPSKLRYHFDLSKLGDMATTPKNSSGKPYEVLVFQEEWSPQNTTFFVYDLDFNIHKFDKSTVPSVKKLEANRYVLSFDKLQDGQVLFAWDTTGLYAIALGDAEKQTVSLFDKPNAAASLVEHRIELALESFPENKKLKSLLAVWAKKSLLEKDIKAWQVVEEKYAKYEAEKNINTLDFLASDVTGEIKYYLSLNEGKPKHKARAEKMALQVEQRQKQLVAQINSQKIELPSQEELGSSVRYYTDGNNINISMVEIGSEGDVLIRFTGLDNEHNNVVYRHEKSNQNKNKGTYIYRTREMGGKNWNSFVVESSGWSGNRMYVFAPGENKKIYVANQSDGAGDSALKLYRDYAERIEQRNAAL